MISVSDRRYSARKGCQSRKLGLDWAAAVKVLLAKAMKERGPMGRFGSVDVLP